VLKTEISALSRHQQVKTRTLKKLFLRLLSRHLLGSRRCRNWWTVTSNNRELPKETKTKLNLAKRCLSETSRRATATAEYVNSLLLTLSNNSFILYHTFLFRSGCYSKHVSKTFRDLFMFSFAEYFLFLASCYHHFELSWLSLPVRRLFCYERRNICTKRLLLTFSWTLVIKTYSLNVALCCCVSFLHHNMLLNFR